MHTRGWTQAAFVAVLLGAAGCSPERPAQLAIAAADSALAAAPAESQAYLAPMYQAAVAKIAAARTALEGKDYATALTNANEAVTTIGGFPAAIEARRAELTQSWTGMSTVVPGMLDAIGKRVADLRKMRRLPAGVTKESLVAAAAVVDSSKTTWASAASAYQDGKIPEAVRMATTVKMQAAETMRSLGMEM